MIHTLAAKMRPCRGTRAYVVAAHEKQLQWLATACADVLGGLLVERGFLCPVYQEIYFNVGATMEEARSRHAAVESWHENAYAAVDLVAFAEAEPPEQAKLVLRSFLSALRELADRDGLDRATIDTVASVIERDGLDADVGFLRRETKKHIALITYRVKLQVIEAHFTLRVTARASGRVATRDLGWHDLWHVRYRYAHLDLMRESVRIRPRRGLRASAYNHGELAPLHFSYAELFDPPIGP